MIVLNFLSPLQVSALGGHSQLRLSLAVTAGQCYLKTMPDHTANSTHAREVVASRTEQTGDWCNPDSAPVYPEVDLRWGPYSLYQWSSEERMLLIEDSRIDVPADEDEAAWDAALLHAEKILGHVPFDSDPDLEVGPLSFYFLVPSPSA